MIPSIQHESEISHPPKRFWKRIFGNPFTFVLALRWLTWLNALALVQFNALPADAILPPSSLLIFTFFYNAALSWLPYQPLPPIPPSRRVAILVAFDLLSGLSIGALSGGWHSPFYLYSLSVLLLSPYYYGARGILVSVIALITWHIYLTANQPATVPLTTTLDTITLGAALIVAAYVLGTRDMLWRLAERRAAHLAILNRVAEVIAAVPEDEDTLLKRIAMIVREELDYKHFGIGLLDEGQIIFRASLGLPPKRMEQLSSSHEQSIGDWVMQNGKLLHISDIRQAPGYVGFCSDTRSVLCVPIRDEERVLGILDVESHRANAFGIHDEQLLTALADETRIGLERIESEAQARELVAQEARLYMARYLHDETVQQMYGVILALKDTLRRIGSSPERAQLQATLGLAIQAWEDLRAYLQDLRLPLGEATLSEVMNQRATEFTRLTGLPVHVEVEKPEPTLSIEVRARMAAIIRVALSNIYRHAQATTVWLRLRDENGEVVLEIQDDGIGFDPGNVSEAHGQLGLIGIRERAEGMGGRLEIESAPTNGTKLVVRVPLERKANDGKDHAAAGG